MPQATALRRPWSHPVHVNRWVQLVGGVVAMMVIAGLLFVWPILRSPPGESLAHTLAASENAFAAFIFTETIFVPLEAWLGDRIPRWLLVGAGVALVIVGAVAGAAAPTVRGRVFWYVLGGVGAGLAYGGTVAKALRNFTDRKALCVGVTAAASAGVVLLALGAIVVLSTSSGSAVPLLVILGAGQAAVILIATLFILEPPPPKPPAEW